MITFLRNGTASLLPSNQCNMTQQQQCIKLHAALETGTLALAATAVTKLLIFLIFVQLANCTRVTARPPTSVLLELFTS